MSLCVVSRLKSFEEKYSFKVGLLYVYLFHKGTCPLISFYRHVCNNSPIILLLSDIPWNQSRKRTSEKTEGQKGSAGKLW